MGTPHRWRPARRYASSAWRQSDAGLGRDDFWLFDDDSSALLAYDGDGRAERVSLTNEPGKLALLRATRTGRSVCKATVPVRGRQQDHRRKDPVQHEHQMG